MIANDLRELVFGKVITRRYLTFSKVLNPFQFSVEFHIETSHLFCRAKQIMVSV